MSREIIEANFLYIFDFDSLGLAYVKVQETLSHHSGVRLFEILPTHSGAAVLFYSNEQNDRLEGGFCIPLKSQDLLKALQSLVEPQRVENLVVLEAQQTGPFLSTANELLTAGCKLLDLRLSRGRKNHHAFFTTKLEAISVKNQNLKLHLIQKPTSELLALFELS